jgi:hypothetical protein
MIASGVLALLTAGALLAIGFDQIAVRKAKEQAIAMDFLTHYVENIKALPFNYIVAGYPVNSIYNGANGAPAILIPADSSWVPIDTADFETFDPDLLWLSNRHPKMQVTLTPNLVGGVLHDLEVNVKMDWDAPLSRGGRLDVQVDIFRTKDVANL